MRRKKKFILSSFNQKGAALLFALMVILVLGGLTAVFLNSHKKFFSTNALEKRRKILDIRALNGAEITKNRITAKISPLMAVIPDLPDGVSYQLLKDIPIVFGANGTKDPATGVFVVTSQQNETYEIRSCVEYDSHSGTAGAYVPCSTARSRLPKFFTMIYRAVDPKSGIIALANLKFEVAAASLNQFAYLITNTQRDFHAGATEYTGNMGVFFANPGGNARPSGNLLHLIADPSGGAVFDDLLVTNLPDISGIVKDAGATDPQFKKGMLLGAPATVAADIAQNFISLRNSVNHSAYSDVPTTITCGGGYDSCQQNAVLQYNLELGGANGDCWVQASQVASYTAHSVGAPPGTTSTVTITTPFYSGVPNDKEIFLMGNAPTYVGAPSGGTIGTVCHKNLFMSDGPMILRTSISKSSQTPGRDQGNSVFMPKGDFLINDQTVLANGNTIAQQRTAGSLPSSTVALSIDGSIIPAGTPGLPSNFTIDPSVFPATQSTTAVNLGTLQISGMVESGEATYTHFILTDTSGTAIDGFGKTNIVFNQTLATDPPPGVDLPIDAGLRASVTSMRTSDVQVSEALAGLN